jgi:hypothetical protein
MQTEESESLEAQNHTTATTNSVAQEEATDGKNLSITISKENC